MTTPSNPPAAARVLVVDDEPDLRTLYELTLLRAGHEVEAAGSLAEARARLAASRYELVITDMRLPDGLGLELLRELAAAQRPERSIVITAYGSAENAVEALKCGAFDYLTKPVELKLFRDVVGAALQAAGGAPEATEPAAARPVSATPPPPPRTSDSTEPRTAEPPALARLVGESATMRAVKQRIVKVASSMAPVLVHGESGTGKELVAGAIHACSHRAGGPFVPVNCGAIPENLLEAEFFGARKGSYTGATQDRPGFFQAARGGTLFLDEIGDLPLAMQAKLLRAIQERRVRPLGEPQEEPVDVRIVSATHKNLAAEVQAGRFRQDLFYRLNVIEIVIPPLRDRREDIPVIGEVLLARIAAESGTPAPQLSPGQWQEIRTAPLEGNVRELENLLHRAVALGEAANLGLDRQSTLATPAPEAPVSIASSGPPEAAPPALPAPAPSDLAAGHASLASWLDAQERQVLVQALDAATLDLDAAAAVLGLNRRQLRHRLARLGIAAPLSQGQNADAGG